MTASMRRSARAVLPALTLATAGAAFLEAQAPQAAPPGIYQRYAPIDLTGTWVSIVTEDWEYRMLTPAKGDFASLPLTKAAQDGANRTNMAEVEAAGRACEAYGAPVVMREPGRVRISWQDSSILRIETDAGEQTRLLHFGAPAAPPGEPSRQGYSVAEWQYANGFDPLRAAAVPGDGRGGSARGGGPPAAGGAGRGGPSSPVPAGGRLKVETRNLTPGFLRKNGVPYSSQTTVTEYYNVLADPAGGTRWLVVTTIVRDPENLVVEFITSTNFRQEPDGSTWRPRPCSLR